MGCGVSRANLEDQELTIEEQTQEGQMGITNEEVMAAQARKKHKQKQPPQPKSKHFGESNGHHCDNIETLPDSDSNSDTIIVDSGTDSSTDDDDMVEEYRLRRRARQEIERLDLLVDSDKEHMEGGDNENKAVNSRNAVDILNHKHCAIM